MRQVAPEQEFHSRVVGFDTGLVGTVGVQILDEDGDTVVDRHTTGIIENPAGSGSYLAALTAPADEGEYTVWWDPGAVADGMAEGLNVSAAPDFANTSDLYCTLDQLKQARDLSGYSYLDSQMNLAIASASRGIDAACNRRFWLDADANQTRYYTPTVPSILKIDDLVTLTSVSVDRTGNSTWTELTVDNDFFLTPFNNPADGKPYKWLEINDSRRFAHPVRGFPIRPRSVKVVGQFGWAQVPTEVQQACQIIAAKLLIRVREAPFGILTFGTDAGVAMRRLAEIDPDVSMLLANVTDNQVF